MNDETGPSFVRDEDEYIPIGNKSKHDPHYSVSVDLLQHLTKAFDDSLYGVIDGNDGAANMSNLIFWLERCTTVEVDAWIQNIATGLTNAVRSDSSRWLKEEYNGTQYELAVVVRWAWLVLPGALVLSSLAFLIAVIARTARSSVKSWKGSPLTILLFELDSVLREAAIERLDEHNGAEEAVGGQTVRLVRTVDKRWRFDAA